MNVLMFNFKYWNSIGALLAGIVVTIVLVVLGTIFLKNKSEKTKLLPIRICFYILIILRDFDCFWFSLICISFK